MSKVLCSTGALIGRPNGRNHKLLAEFAGRLCCDGFELMMYDSWYEELEQVIADILEMKLYIPVVHCEKTIGQAISVGGEEKLREALRLFEVNAAAAAKLGAGKMVLHLWDGIPSDGTFEKNIATYPLLLEIAEKYALDLLVENVVCNVQSPMQRILQLQELYPEIHFVFDTKMAAFHWELEELYKQENAALWKNIHHYHVNDYAGEYKEWSKLKTLPIGRGNIDFEDFFSFIKKIGYDDTFTIEGTAFDKEGRVDFEVLNQCVNFIREHVSQGA